MSLFVLCKIHGITIISDNSHCLMPSSGVGNLHFLESNMDKYVYCDILKKNLKESATKLGIENNFVFYQDNDPKHSSYLIREWCLYNCPKTIKPPAQSPDINVIENLWNKLEKEVRKHEISNKEDLKRALKEEWEKISPNYTKN